MIEVAVTGNGRNWIWRFPGDDAALILAFQNGNFPPSESAAGELEVVPHMQLLDRMIELGSGSSTLYIGDDTYSAGAKEVEPPPPPVRPLPKQIAVDSEPRPRVMHVQRGPMNLHFLWAEIDGRLDLSGLEELHVVASSIPDAVVPLVTHLEVRGYSTLGNHTWPRLVDLTLTSTYPSQNTPHLPRLQRSRVLHEIRAAAGLEETEQAARDRALAEASAFLDRVLPDSDRSGLTVDVRMPSEAQLTAHAAMKARLDPARIGALLQELLDVGSGDAMRRSKPWKALIAMEDDVQDSVAAQALTRFLDDTSLENARWIAERLWRGPYPGEPLQSASEAALRRVEMLPLEQQGGLAVRLHAVVHKSQGRPRYPDAPVETHTVETVRRHLANGEPVQALHVLRDAWIETRDPETGALVDALARKIVREPLTVNAPRWAEGAGAAHVEWMKRASSGDLADLTPMIDALSELHNHTNRERKEVITRLGSWAPDPRLGDALRRWQMSDAPTARLIKANGDPWGARDLHTSNASTAKARRTLLTAPMGRGGLFPLFEDIAAMTPVRAEPWFPAKEASPSASSLATEGSDDARSVLGDQIGGTHGEFIQLQLLAERQKLTGKQQKAMKALERDHAMEWLGPIAGVVDSKRRRFRRGFLERAELVVRGAADVADDPALSTVEQVWSRHTSILRGAGLAGLKRAGMLMSPRLPWERSPYRDVVFPKGGTGFKPNQIATVLKGKTVPWISLQLRTGSSPSADAKHLSKITFANLEEVVVDGGYFGHESPLDGLPMDQVKRVAGAGLNIAETYPSLEWVCSAWRDWGIELTRAEKGWAVRAAFLPSKVPPIAAQYLERSLQELSVPVASVEVVFHVPKVGQTDEGKRMTERWMLLH